MKYLDYSGLQYYTDKLKTTYALKSELPDMSNYALKSDVTNQIASKQDKLVSGTNIKTINGQTLLGEGDVDMSKFALKTELGNYLPLSGGSLFYPDGEEYIYTHFNGLGISINTDENFYTEPHIFLARQGSGALSTYMFELNSFEGNTSKGLVLQTKGSYDLAKTINSNNICALYFGDRAMGIYNADLIINPVGVFIKDKTSSDLLHAAGGTVSIDDIKSQVQYTLPAASATQLGGIKVGDGLEITQGGVLNCIIDPGSGTVSWGNISGKPTFAAVATSGSYNDLTDTPNIEVASEQEIDALFI